MAYTDWTLVNKDRPAQHSVHSVLSGQKASLITPVTYRSVPTAKRCDLRCLLLLLFYTVFLHKPHRLVPSSLEHGHPVGHREGGPGVYFWFGQSDEVCGAF